MPLNQYKNTENILSSTRFIRGNRLTKKEMDLLNPNLINANFGIESYGPWLDGISSGWNKRYNNDVVELHLYTMDGVYINGNHKVLTWEIIDTVDTRSIYYNYLNDKKIKLNTYQDLSEFGYKNLPMKMVYNFHRDIFSSYLSLKKPFIKEISANRLEVRVALENDPSNELLQEYNNFLFSFVINKPNYFPNILLNFGLNSLHLTVNIVEDLNNELLIKLYEPLPTDIVKGDKFHITMQILKPQIESVFLYDNTPSITYNTLSGPNFDIETDYRVKNDTPYTSWDDILNTTIASTQKVLDNIDSGLNEIRKNVDYSDPSRFIHYSHLTLRVNNFLTKIKRIEGYNNLINSLDGINGDLGQTKTNYITLKNKIITEFDDFEKYLYFSPPLDETTTEDGYPLQGVIGKINPYPKPHTTIQYPEQTSWDLWADVWAESVIYWGRSGGEETFYQKYPYTIADTTDLYVAGWYRETMRVAEEFDKNNIYALRKSLPEYILNNTLNDDFVKFIDMIAHHFDLLWIYITYLSRFNKREHNPHNSFPDKMLYDVTNDFGWYLSNGANNSDIGLYKLGISESDTKLQPERKGLMTKSDQERVYEIWRRILNNLPYIYKSKGTSKSVQSLITSYGVPSTILKTVEYSGKSTKLNRKSTLTYEKHTYSVKFGNNKYITIPWDEFEVKS